MTDESSKTTCPHPSFSKEYMGGMDTGDKICDDCGEVFTRGQWLAMKQPRE